MKYRTAIAALAVSAFAMPVLAQTATPGIDQRQARQAQRIEAGKQSGALNDREAARMQKGQAKVQRMEDEARADGKVTAEERRSIKREQDRQSARIHRQKHDRQHSQAR